MGAAKRRGTFDERKAQAIKAGRIKSYRVSHRRVLPMSNMSTLIQGLSMLPLITRLALRRRSEKREGILPRSTKEASYPID